MHEDDVSPDLPTFQVLEVLESNVDITDISLLYTSKQRAEIKNKLKELGAREINGHILV